MTIPLIPVAWAKRERLEDGSDLALPLIEHALDVAACMAALLAGEGWRRALEATAGRALTALDVARIVALAALHDIGKANWGFQARADKGAPPIGHEGQVAALVSSPKLRATPAGQAFLRATLDWGAWTLLPALMAHHGRLREEFAAPSAMGGLNEKWKEHVRYWSLKDGYDPAAEALALIEAVRARYPLAWEAGEKLPVTPRFAALFAGLVTMADWLGSDTRLFPVAGPYGAARAAWRDDRAAEAVWERGLAPIDTPPKNFAAAFGLAAPRGAQAEAAADDLGAVALIEAETGSGKTEAALWRWLALRRSGEVDGLFFALPTRSAAVQLHKRVQDTLCRVWGDAAPDAVLAVPGYLRAGEAEGQALTGWGVRWDDGEGPAADGRWAAERSNRFLAARVAVGTIDQALLGALPVKHAPVRAAALARSLLVVDEVHASDAYMGGLLEALIANHVEAGGRALLLSATLGVAARARLLGGPVPPLEEAIALPYPALSGRAAPPRAVAAEGGREKRVAIETAGIIDDADAIAARAVAAARAGASVLVIRNSVGGAVRVAQAVEAIAPDLTFCVDDVPTLHHGRFAADDRRRLDAAVEGAFGEKRTAQGRVLVGTQTLEQSLDIDADLLLTDLAPMDVLLQRIGRLHRHRRSDRGAFTEPRVVVLRPAERDLTRLLGRVEKRHGLGPNAQESGAYPDLRQIEATLRLLEANAAVTIPADNRRLVEGALHPDVLKAVSDGLGAEWRNHGNDRAASDFGDRDAANRLSLDFGTAFNRLVFLDKDEKVTTRLGAQDLLVDVDLPGAFGGRVDRIAIPHWMAGAVGDGERPDILGADADGVRFRLGGRGYVYGRWGLSPAA